MTTEPSIRALAKIHGVDRKTIRSWRKKGRLPPHPHGTPGTPGRADPVNGNVVPMAPAVPPLGLTQLRDEIADWATLARKAAKLKALDRAGRTGRALPMFLFVLAVGFYGLVALAALG